jgi:potassium large conductance calcium-activated channel subfamily M alpha protein 1
LECFEKVGIIEGSPLNGNALQKAALNYCDMCVILSPRRNEKQMAAMTEMTLMDKESILTTLNIKGMKFSELENNPLVLHAGGPAVVGHQPRRQRAGQQPVRHGHDIHTLTDLLIDTNVQLIDFDDDDDHNSFELYRATPFAFGNVIATSVLDSLMSAIYFNPNIVTVVKLLIRGQIGSKGDHDGGFFDEAYERDDNVNLTSQTISCHVQQYDLFTSPYADYGEDSEENTLRYGHLFLKLLETERMLSLGIYRCRDCLDQNGPRYVVTAPASNFRLHKFDRLFVLCCGNQSCSEEGIVLTGSDDEGRPFSSIRTVNVKEKNHPLFGSNDDVSAV